MAGYLILRTIEGAGARIFGGPSGPLGDITPGIQAGAAALGAGAVNVVGAGVTGAAGGAAEAFRSGLAEVLKPDIPLRTFEPVPEVRIIPFEEQASFREQPLITVEQLEEIKAGRGSAAEAPQQISAQPQPFIRLAGLQIPTPQRAAPVSFVSAGPPGPYWVNPTSGGFLAPFVRGETPASVLELRQEDIFPAIRGL